MFRCGANRVLGQSLRCVNGGMKKSVSSCAAGRSVGTRLAAQLKTTAAPQGTAPSAFITGRPSSPMSRLAMASVERMQVQRSMTVALATKFAPLLTASVQGPGALDDLESELEEDEECMTVSLLSCM